MKKIFILVFLSIIVFSPLLAFAQANFTTAQDYLANHAENPWSTMALTILGVQSIPADYLKSISGTSAIELAAPILAIAALNQDPRTFGSIDYVTELKKYHTNLQLGDHGTINDDIFGLIAFLSAGEPSIDSTVMDAKNFIVAHQRENGGWGYTTSGGTDSNMTAAAIVALIADGISASNAIIQKALNYLKTTQNNDGGFTYDPQSPWGTDSDSSSTAWAIWALTAANINPDTWSKPGGTPASYLGSNQDATGFFKYQNSSSEDSFSATTTAYAVIALAGKTFPLNIFQPPGGSVTPDNSSGGGGARGAAPTLTPAPILAPIPKDTPGQVLGAITYAPGTLVKTAGNHTVYLVANGKLRPFSSESIFFAYGLKFSSVQIIGSNIILADNLGAIMDYPDGTPHE